MMLGLLFPLVTYAEWFFRSHELQAIYPFDSHYASAETSGVPGLEESRVTATDGTALILWRRTADPGRPTVLYLPGNAGNLGGRAYRFQDLARQGYGIVALSWRGQGGSGGRPDEALLSADALMVYDMTAGLRPVIYGESLGTAVAVKIAGERHVRGVVLESPFTSIPDLAAMQYPGEDLRPFITQIWDSASRIAAVDEPLLILSGTADKLVPPAQGEALFAGASSADKTLVRIEGRDHSGLWTDEGRRALYAFLDRF